MKHNSRYLGILKEFDGCTISRDCLERWDWYANAEEHKCHGSLAPVKRMEGNREIGERRCASLPFFWAESDSRENGRMSYKEEEMQWADGVES